MKTFSLIVFLLWAIPTIASEPEPCSSKLIVIQNQITQGWSVKLIQSCRGNTEVKAFNCSQKPVDEDSVINKLCGRENATD
jgi:hypothetical protein